jgi:spermidine/putrescine transport system permease protein
MGWLFLFFFIPACIVYAYAFRTTDLNGTITPFWSLDAMKMLLHQRSLVTILRTIHLSAWTTLLCVTLAVPVAYIMATAPAKHQKKLLFLIVLPLWSSFLVRIFAWKILLHPEGIVKNSLVFLGLINEKTPLLYNNIAVLLVMCYSYLPFAILPLYSAASKFNFDLFEAAMDLGVTKRQAFFKIFLPGIRPAILTAALMVLIPAAGAYVIPEIVGGKSSEMVGNLIAERVFIARDLPDASALSVLLSVLLFIPSIIAATWKSRQEKQKKAAA